MHRASKQASTTLIFCRNPASSNSLRVSRIASAISGGSSRWLFRLFLVPAHDSFRLRRSSFVEVKVKLDAIDHVEIVVSSAASIPSSVASPAMPYCPIRVLETSGCQHPLVRRGSLLVQPQRAGSGVPTTRSFSSRVLGASKNPGGVQHRTSDRHHHGPKMEPLAGSLDSSREGPGKVDEVHRHL